MHGVRGRTRLQYRHRSVRLRPDELPQRLLQRRRNWHVRSVRLTVTRLVRHCGTHLCSLQPVDVVHQRRMRLRRRTRLHGHINLLRPWVRRPTNERDELWHVRAQLSRRPMHWRSVPGSHAERDGRRGVLHHARCH